MVSKKCHNCSKHSADENGSCPVFVCLKFVSKCKFGRVIIDNYLLTVILWAHNVKLKDSLRELIIGGKKTNNDQFPLEGGFLWYIFRHTGKRWWTYWRYVQWHWTMGQWGIKAADNIAGKSAPRGGPPPRSSVLLKFLCCVIKCATRPEYKLANCFFNQLYPVQLSKILSAPFSSIYYISF